MAGLSKRRRQKFESFLTHLRHILESLPSDSEKREAEEALTRLIEFLTDVKARLKVLPSEEEVSTLQTAVRTLEETFAKAEGDPVLAGVLGVKRVGVKRRKSDGLVLEEAKRAVEALESLPVEEIRSKLGSDLYPLKTLRAIASVLGLKPMKGVGREALVHQVAMRIANVRGYERLRGDAQPHGSWERPEEPRSD